MSTFYAPPIGDGVTRGRAVLGLLVLLLMVLAGFVVVVATAVLFGLGGEMVSDDPTSSTKPDPLVLVGSVLLMPVLLLPGAFLAGWIGLRRPPWQLASARGAFRFRIFARACIPAAVIGLASTLLFGIAGGPGLGTPTIAVGVAATLAVLLVLGPLQAFSEELTFRGVLIQLLVVIFPRGRAAGVHWGLLGAALVSALLFTLIHGGAGGPAMFLGALLWTWLAHRLGGIEAASAAHFVFNYLLFAFSLLGLLSGGTTLTPGIWPVLQLVVTDLAMVAAIWLFVGRAARAAK